MERQAEQLLTLLKEASYYPDGMTFLRVGKNPGLIPSKTGPLFESAQQALQAGYLELIKQEGKADAVRLTARGEVYLREHQDPRKSLEELLYQLRTSEQNFPRWLADIESQMAAFRLRTQAFLEQQGEGLHKLIARAEAALRRIEAGQVPATLPALEAWQIETLHVLHRRGRSNQAQTPFPWLFSHLQQVGFNHLTIPDFHAGLQLLQDQGSIKLIKLSTTLDQLAEPEYALASDGVIYYSAQQS
jgi:hypothetical protein